MSISIRSLFGTVGMGLRPLELLPFLFTRPGRDDLVVVTGADSTHYRSLRQLLASLREHEPRTPTVVYDLGFTAAQRDAFHQELPTVVLRSFDYSAYPDYFNIRVAHGHYAWKPVILGDVLAEFQGMVCWMDAGNIVTRPLTWIRKIVSRTGIYTARSNGSIRDWTHAGTLDYLQVPSALLDRHNLSAGMVAVNYRDRRARALIQRWKACALVEQCIAPAGSSRANHRQDQAVLSVLAHQAGLTTWMPKKRYGFKVQQDID